MRDTKQTTNKNVTYIVIFTIMIIVVALLIIFIPKLKNKDTSSSNSSPDSVSVMSTEGSQDETISKSIKNLTDVKFGSKRKSISSYERNRKVLRMVHTQLLQMEKLHILHTNSARRIHLNTLVHKFFLLILTLYFSMYLTKKVSFMKCVYSMANFQRILMML